MEKFWEKLMKFGSMLLGALVLLVMVLSVVLLFLAVKQVATEGFLKEQPTVSVHTIADVNAKEIEAIKKQINELVKANGLEQAKPLGTLILNENGELVPQ